MKIGLTGGIGSGKSTVAAMLAQLGAGVVDADAIARSVTATGGTAITAIQEKFGAAFITEDGALDREQMRAYVFLHPEARTQLEAITHPLIKEAMFAKVQTLTSNHTVIIMDIPLLAESQTWRRQLDRVCVVDCSQDTQLARVQNRNGWSQETILSVIKAQASRQQRLSQADDVIFNETLSLTQLQDQVMQLAQHWGLGLARLNHT
jgi:dephospho-CoA kinase